MDTNVPEKPRGGEIGSAPTPPPLIQPGGSVSDGKIYKLPGGVEIKFQSGAMELGRNGVTTEELLDVVLEHLGGFQKGPFSCRENALAITNIETGKLWILDRARKRAEQGLKGRAAAHAS